MRPSTSGLYSDLPTTWGVGNLYLLQRRNDRLSGQLPPANHRLSRQTQQQLFGSLFGICASFGLPRLLEHHQDTRYMRKPCLQSLCQKPFNRNNAAITISSSFEGFEFSHLDAVIRRSPEKEPDWTAATQTGLIRGNTSSWTCADGELS